jgi:hypothetical protein
VAAPPKRGSDAARLLGLRVRIPPKARMSVSCDCCVLSGRGLYRADHSSREVLLSVVCLSDREDSIMSRPRHTRGCCAMGGGGVGRV